MNEIVFKSLSPFFDGKGRLTQYPAKRKKKNYALLFFASKFELERRYTENEVNDLLDEWHTFHDPATLRRELYNSRFLDRTADGREYWLSSNPPTMEELENHP